MATEEDLKKEYAEGYADGKEAGRQEKLEEIKEYLEEINDKHGAGGSSSIIFARFNIGMFGEM